MPRKQSQKQKQKQKQKQRQSQRVVVNVGTPAPRRRRASTRKPKQSAEEAEYIASLNRVIPPVNIISQPTAQPMLQPMVAPAPVPILNPELATGFQDILTALQSNAQRSQAAYARMQEEQDAAQAQRMQQREVRAAAAAAAEPAKLHPLSKPPQPNTSPPPLYRQQSAGSTLQTAPFQELRTVQAEAFFPTLAEAQVLPIQQATTMKPPAKKMTDAEIKAAAEAGLKSAGLKMKPKDLPKPKPKYDTFEEEEDSDVAIRTPLRTAGKSRVKGKIEPLTGAAQPRVEDYFNTKSAVQPGLR